MSSSFSSIAVFCGAADGALPEYVQTATALGEAIAARGQRLIYGGGSLGLMGAVADGALSKRGNVIGVITKQLVAKEVAHQGLSELLVVETMHERKMMMATMSDAFIVLPGGLGTLDEMFEILAWAQLGIHRKPVGLLDVAGYYHKLMEFLDHAADQRFLRVRHREHIVLETKVAAMLDRLISHAPTPPQPLIAPGGTPR